MTTLNEMKELLVQYLQTSELYKGAYVMNDDCVSGDNVIGLCFEETYMDYEWFMDGDTALQKFINSKGYDMEWYNSIEAHIYKM